MWKAKVKEREDGRRRIYRHATWPKLTLQRQQRNVGQHFRITRKHQTSPLMQQVQR
jgi:hypothetical protein